MRPRHNKKRSMEEIRNFKTNIPTIPACSSTRFENSGDLNTFSGCLTVRASIAEKMKKLEKAQKSMSDKYEQCLTHLYEQMKKKETKNLQLKFQIEQLERRTKQVSMDIEVIEQYSDRKNPKIKDRSKVVSKQNHLVRQKPFLFYNHHKNSQRLFRFVKPGLVM